MLRKTSAAAAIIAFATVGSALFGGVALADGDHKEGKEQASVSNTGGVGGGGGDVRQECEQDATAFNVIFDSSLKADDVTQKATASNTCDATGGAGGAGGTGATY